MKRKGTSVTEAMEQVDIVVQRIRPSLPPAVSLSYINNTAPLVIEQNMGLQGNMATAMVLVLIVVIASVGVRSGLLVTLAVPSRSSSPSSLFAYLGFTYNFMVMFGLLLGLGMLIDGAIVMVEYADRKMAEGLNARDAYRAAVDRMYWPILASTATTLAAFLADHVLAWGFRAVHELPAHHGICRSNRLAVLCAIVRPNHRRLIGKSSAADQTYLQNLEGGDPLKTGGITAVYAKILGFAVAPL